ncbi:MAG: flagellar hook basal-body protein, partial [Planctomycetota bacterium]
NLANISTPGYRRRVESYESYERKANALGTGIEAPRFNMKIDFTPGTIQQTGNHLDLALTNESTKDGNAFFVLKTPNGGERFTRSGRFSMDSEGHMVHASSGLPLILPNGTPVTLNPSGGDPTIDVQGRISQAGQEVGQIHVARFGRLDNVRPLDHGLFSPGSNNSTESVAGNVEIRQGQLEMSNAGVVDELVNMITNYRAYETSQRIIKTMDQTAQKLLQVAAA